jgi:hypothetical protein
MSMETEAIKEKRRKETEALNQAMDNVRLRWIVQDRRCPYA